MIRLRRLPRKGFLRRRLYEIEFPAPDEGGSPIRRVTSTPVTAIDKLLGVGEAWALVHAADKAWDGQLGKWVTLHDDTSS